MDDKLVDFADFPFYLNCIIQIISFIYITKKCFVGKCSVIRNIIHFVICIIFFPIVSFLIMMSVVGYIPIPSSLLSIFSQMSFIMLYFSGIAIIILCLMTFIFVLYCGKENSAIAAFIYLMFYMISLFGLSFSLAGFDNAALNVFNIIIVCVIQFLFCFYILPQIVLLSKKKQEFNKKEFYILPIFYNFISFFILGCMLNKITNEEKISLIAILIFLEFLVLITFNYMLKNISHINKISNQNENLEKAKNEIKTLSVEVMEALAHTIDAKDEYTKGHSIRVALYSKMIAEKLGLSDEECENIYYMGLLHDLGKIGVPNEIINSPKPLTDEQYEIIKSHPSLGFEILSEIKSRPDLSIGARWHHERFDGKGYPDRKSGEEIPLMARIISVADSYDAMTSNRSYRNYMAQDRVIEELKNNKGTQFDPKIAECMISIINDDADYTLHE